MNPIYILLIYLCAVILFAIIHKAGRNKKPVKRAFLSLITGFMSLVLVNVTSPFTGVYLPVSLLSVSVCTIGGIPGTTALLVLNLFF